MSSDGCQLSIKDRGSSLQTRAYVASRLRRVGAVSDDLEVPRFGETTSMSMG